MSTDWQIAWTGWDPASEGLREALSTLGNGRFCTRGSTLCAEASAESYPGTYLAGGYDRAISTVAGHEVENEDLVRLPDWLPIRIHLDGVPLTLSRSRAESYEQTLDLRKGRLERGYVLAAPGGRRLRFAETRLVSMRRSSLAAVKLEITALGWNGQACLEAFLEGGVENGGVPRYAALERRHLCGIAADHPSPGIARLRCRTIRSELDIVLASRLSVTGEPLLEPICKDERAGHRAMLTLRDGETACIEKVVALTTSRDPAMASPSLAAPSIVAAAPSFADLASEQEQAWQELWDGFDIGLSDGGGDHRRNLRLNTFHLVQTLSPHTAELDVGAPARGWHGEAYRGHVFWDEIFVFRVLNLRAPRLTRALLRYRLRRLPAARQAAAAAGFRGAMFPWQSGSDGREETQKLHLNPRSGRWLPDETQRQRHVGLGIAYNVWTYYQATGDLDFLAEGGAEVMIEVARFFASLAEKGPSDDRRHLRGVMGPDEFQTAYPGRTGGGIDDNAYTNVLCAWVMAQTVEALEHLPPARRAQLERALSLGLEEVALWQDLSERLFVPFLSNGYLAQFAGYESLEELDWPDYRERYGDISRLDRILEAEGRDVNAYKASKQADVLMLLFLFTADELTAVLNQLGYAFDAASIPAMVSYYDARTSHGSSLSAVVHAWVVARSDRGRSWSLFGRALRTDVDDEGGTTREGIHLGAMCGTIDLLQSGYVGLDARGGMLRVDPALPAPLRSVTTRVRYRGQDVSVHVTKEAVTLTAGGGSVLPVTVGYRGRARQLAPGAATVFRLVPAPQSREAVTPPEAETPD